MKHTEGKDWDEKCPECGTDNVELDESTSGEEHWVCDNGHEWWLDVEIRRTVRNDES